MCRLLRHSYCDRSRVSSALASYESHTDRMMKGSPDELWERVGALFAEPDGGLPEVTLCGLAPAEVPRVAALLGGCATDVRGAMTWDLRGDEVVEVPMDVGNLAQAAAEVVEDRRESFHCVLTGMVHSGVTIPDLGAFIFDDEIALDYAPGAHWTPPALAALADLWCAVRRLAPAVRIELDKHTRAEWRRTFADAVAQYCDPEAAG